MKKNNMALAIAACTASLAGGGMAQGALAQERASNDVFEEVLVTATKRSQSIYEVPLAISAFNGEELQKQGILQFWDDRQISGGNDWLPEMEQAMQLQIANYK